MTGKNETQRFRKFLTETIYFLVVQNDVESIAADMFFQKYHFSLEASDRDNNSQQLLLIWAQLFKTNDVVS